MTRQHLTYPQMRERLSFTHVKRIKNGRWEVEFEGNRWTIWKGINGRWYGHHGLFPGFMIDAPTFAVAKSDLRMRRFVKVGHVDIGEESDA